MIEEGVHRNVEYTLLRKDGTTFAAEVSSAVIRDAAGNPEALMAVYRDITDASGPRRNWRHWGRFVEAASQGFGMSDVDGRITYLNPLMARLLGGRDRKMSSARTSPPTIPPTICEPGRNDHPGP